MAKSPETRKTLIDRIRDAHDGEAWTQFVEIYTPLVYAYGRKHGLQDADAVDLAQEVLKTVARSAHSFEYDPHRGSFRGWLFTITRNKLRTHLARDRKRVQATGDTRVKELLDDHAEESAKQETWERAYEQQLFAWASERVRGQFQETTWSAFWQTTVENKPAQTVAQSLGLGPTAVYIAKSRVLARLRQTIETVTGE